MEPVQIVGAYENEYVLHTATNHGASGAPAKPRTEAGGTVHERETLGGTKFDIH